MIKNYFKIAFRNLMKHRLISFINLFGLTVGLTCCLLITTYVLHELSYDRYNKNASDIYRVTRTFYNTDGGISLNLSTVAPPFGPLLQNDFPDIKQVTRLYPDGLTPLRYREKLFNERNCFWAEGNFFDVFTVQTVDGDPHKALQEPYSIMLTEEMAKKYFGNEDPMNKTLRYNNQFNFKVTGIYKSFPEDAHIHPAMLLSFSTLKDSVVYGDYNLHHDFGNNSFFTYLLMSKRYPVENLKKQFPAFIEKYMQGVYKGSGMTPSKATSLGLQRLADIHLYSHTDYEAEDPGDINRVYVFTVIALVILIIASINYMNLSTARSVLRAKEIGIRKVIGARKRSLIWQFLSESVIITWAAAILAMILTYFILPWINSFSGLHLSINILLAWKILLSVLFFPFVVGILSGLYPAVFMSSFQPINTLKGLFQVAGRNISMRKVLVVAQFSISIVLIIATIIVFQQLRFVQNASLGINKEQVVTMPFNSTLSKPYESFRTDLLQNSNIKSVSRSSRIPGGRLLDDQG
ncbi:MAG TPA: ABC transporter permease, partial [Puia sp.]|nr:ABC transporter permease [Puia sp.]